MYGLPGLMSAHFHSRDYIPEVEAHREAAAPAPVEEAEDTDDIPF